MLKINFPPKMTIFLFEPTPQMPPSRGYSSNSRVSKAELIQAVASSVGSAKAKRIINAVLEVILEVLQNGGEVELEGIGILRTRLMQEVTCVCPATNQTKVIPKHLRIYFEVLNSS